jgi:hypothetical protein
VAFTRVSPGSMVTSGRVINREMGRSFIRPKLAACGGGQHPQSRV